MKSIYDIDVAVFYAANHVEWGRALTAFWIFLSGQIIWWLIPIAVWFLFKEKRFQFRIFYMLIILLSVVSADLICFYYLKFKFLRYRPCITLPNVRVLGGNCGSAFSFPSNHAANALALATSAAFFVTNKGKWILFSICALIGVSRTISGVHYPLDVLVGFIIGGSVAACITYCFTLLLRNWRSAQRLN